MLLFALFAQFNSFESWHLAAPILPQKISENDKLPSNAIEKSSKVSNLCSPISILPKKYLKAKTYTIQTIYISQTSDRIAYFIEILKTLANAKVGGVPKFRKCFEIPKTAENAALVHLIFDAYSVASAAEVVAAVQSWNGAAVRAAFYAKLIRAYQSIEVAGILQELSAAFIGYSKALWKDPIFVPNADYSQMALFGKEWETFKKSYKLREQIETIEENGEIRRINVCGAARLALDLEYCRLAHCDENLYFLVQEMPLRYHSRERDSDSAVRRNREAFKAKMGFDSLYDLLLEHVLAESTAADRFDGLLRRLDQYKVTKRPKGGARPFSWIAPLL